MPSKGIFIAGTDTDVGKTYVGCLIAESLLAQGIRAAAYKPVASGFADTVGSDGERLWQATGKHLTMETVSPQRFRQPLAPPIAAQCEGRRVDEGLILSGFETVRQACDFVLVEGAGGLMSPVSEHWTNADLISLFDLPMVLVAAWKLGVVNQVLTTLLAADSLGLRVTAIILNACQIGPADPSHRILLERFLGSKRSTKLTQTNPEHWSQIPLIEVSHLATSFPLATLYNRI